MSTVITFSMDSTEISDLQSKKIGRNSRGGPIYLGDGDAFKNTVSKILKKFMDETYDWLMIEGTGVAGGQTPKGGVPVWQGDPSKTTFYPGALRDAHNKESNGQLNKAITVNNYLFYAPAVINGHARAAPNRYHERALKKALESGVWDDLMEEAITKGAVD